MSGDLSLPVMLATGILPGLGARRAPVPAWHPSSLFEGVMGGFWFDFTDADKLRQTSVDIPPVAAASDPVGLAFDASRWGGKTLAQVLADQPELNSNPGNPFATTTGYVAATPLGSGDFAAVNGKLRLTATDTAGSKRIEYTLATQPGKAYRVRFRGVTTSASLTQAVAWTNVVESPSIDMRTLATHEVTITATSTSSVLRFYISSSGALSVGEYVELEFLEISEIPGNHASQSSSSLRPTYQLTHVRGDGSDDRLITAQNPTLAGTLIYAGTFEAPSDVAIGATGAGGVDRCMLRTSADGYLQAAIGDQASTIIGATDIRGVDGVYAVRWGGNGEAVKLTRGNAVEYAGEQVGSVTTAFPFLIAAVNVGGSPGNFLDGKMRHCLFVPRFITDDELTQAVKYFS